MRMGPRKTVCTPEVERAIYERFSKGETTKHIATELCLNRNTVSSAVQRLRRGGPGDPAQAPPSTGRTPLKPKERRAALLWLTGHGTAEIWKLAQVSGARIREVAEIYSRQLAAEVAAEGVWAQGQSIPETDRWTVEVGHGRGDPWAGRWTETPTGRIDLVGDASKLPTTAWDLDETG